MRANKCLFCEATEVAYSNGRLSRRIQGIQVEFQLCPEHQDRFKEAGEWAEKKIKEMEEAFLTENAFALPKKFPRELCLLCDGSGKLGERECWWCKGEGYVKPVLRKEIR